VSCIDLDDTRNRVLGRILRLHAESAGDRPFLLAGEERFSFARVNSLANRYASGLRALGVGRGDRVVILMHSSVEFVVLALAANKLGAVWVPVNTDYKGDWLADAINDSKGAAIAVDEAHLPRLAQVRERVAFGHLLLHGCTPEQARSAGAAATLADFATEADVEPDMGYQHYGDTAAVLWTSGTTGRSKGVMQSHNVWIRAAENANRQFGTTGSDVAYNCLPLYNSAAWVANIYRALAAGIPCALDPQFSVKEFWNRIRFYGATQTMTLGAMHMFLWNEPPRPDDADNPLRVANMVPMPERLLRPFCERFGIEGITQGFGQSEIMLLLSRADTPQKSWKPNALGELAPGVELRMLKDDGSEAAPGEVGEFCVRETAPHTIFNGYFENPEATAAAFTGEWYHTGDLGIRDPDGDYFFVDRKKDVIRYKGRNVSSLQVESVAMQHPAVQSAAVYGVPSQELDSEHEIKLDLILKPGSTVTHEELARFINANAPHFCVPRYIEFVAELPYTPTNKVQKYKLRERGVTPQSWDRLAAGFGIER
jgi:crotonobetaine/carnitine-CoA ligase